MVSLHRLRTSAARAVLAFLVALANAQIHILSPEYVARQFAETRGVVYGTTSTFGAPFYGQRVIGRLVHSESRGRSHCDRSDYDLDLGERQKLSGKDLVNVLLVRRGQCKFVQKVQVAEEKEAQAVIVVDRSASSMTPKEMQGAEIADEEGWDDAIRIPSVLVGAQEGELLIKAAQRSPVIVELAWDMPRDEVVVADFWMDSGSQESSEFLERFKLSAETLKHHLQFVPHYHIFPLPTGTDTTHLCTDNTFRHCAPDPDGPGPITGAEVADEDVRQLCIWNTTARTASGRLNSTYSQQFWEYVVRFFHECPLEGPDPDNRFGELCSWRVVGELGIDAELVRRCVRENQDVYLDRQTRQVAWSPQALQLNGWRYSGPLDPEQVLKAICSGYTAQPKECRSLLAGYRGLLHVARNTLTFSTFIWTIVALIFLWAIFFTMYRRHVTKSVRKVLREEVMLEVQTQVSDYAPLEDGFRQAQLRTLRY